MKKTLFTILFASTFSTSLLASEGGMINLLIEQMGKTHPMILHFPIVLITFLPIVILATYFPWGKFWGKTVPYFIHLGTITAIAATALGLMLAFNVENIEGTLSLHRTFAILTTLYMVAFSAYVFAKKINFDNEIPKSIFILSSIGTLLISIAAHFGGTTTHGELIILFQ